MEKQTNSPGKDCQDFMEFLTGLFKRGEAMSYGPGEVTMCTHMLQTAEFAERDGAAPELVAAALLHDIGHFGTDFAVDSDDSPHKAMLSATQDRRHEEAGADLLESLFGVDVAEPVRLHVSAKRYLCAIEPNYSDELAETTRYTLNLQGGPMNSEEVKTFEALSHAEDAAKLRRWDDMAIHQGRKVPSLEYYQALLVKLMKAEG